MIMMLMALCWAALAVEQRHGILVGAVLRTDAAAKTVVVKLADGTEHTFHFVKRTTVHGAQGTAAGATDAFRGLKGAARSPFTIPPKERKRLPRRSTISERTD